MSPLAKDFSPLKSLSSSVLVFSPRVHGALKLRYPCMEPFEAQVLLIIWTHGPCGFCRTLQGQLPTLASDRRKRLWGKLSPLGTLHRRVLGSFQSSFKGDMEPYRGCIDKVMSGSILDPWSKLLLLGGSWDTRRITLLLVPIAGP